MAEPAETLRRPKEEKTPEEKRKEFKVIKGGGKKRWGPGAKAGAIVGSTAAVVSGVAAALGETDNLPDPLQGFYDQAFHPSKVAEEKSDQALRGKYDVKEANEDFAKIVNETKTKETPSVVEEAPEKIEWEGVTFSPIEGLRFENGPFYFLDGNPYGGEVGERAGVAVFAEVNGKKTLFFGFRPNVVEFWYKKIMEEEKKIVYVFPIDLEQAKGIKIKEVKNTRLDDVYKSKGVFWDNNNSLEISNIPIGTKIYSPVSTSYYLIWDNNCGRNDPSEPSDYNLGFGFTPETHKGGLLFQKERVDVVDLGIGARGVSLLPSGIEKNIAENELEGYSFLTEAKIGEPIAEVVSEEYRSITIDCFIYQLKDKNVKVGLFLIDVSNVSKALDLGLAGVFKIENIPVFISP